MTKKNFATLVGLVISTLAVVLLTLPLSQALSASADAQKGKIYEVEGAVQKPHRISGDPPAYPEEERKEGIEGWVVVKTVIDEEGTVASTEVVEAETPGLAEAAVAAIREWRFEPATLDGEPVPVYFKLTVRFRLDGKSAEASGSGESVSFNLTSRGLRV